MTMDEIKSKLFAVVTGKPADQMEVVYAFVKIRKMLEHDRHKQKYALVNLFCNWLLHTELTDSTVEEVLDALDGEFRNFNPARPHEFDPKGIVSDTVSLQIFRNELMDFLHENDLPTV